jgi:hypothetical protein
MLERRAAIRAACARPSSFSGVSECPCIRIAWFQSVTPCRTR